MFFGSDNQTGATEKVLAAITDANRGHAHGYGDDKWTQRAAEKIDEVFQTETRTYFVPTGTASNSLALACMVKPWEVILSHHEGHVYIDESTAPEFFTGGARQIALTKSAGKIEPQHLNHFLQQCGDDAPHNARPAALSFAQVSELGRVYSPAEISALSNIAHAHQMYVHMDGARFANAVVASGVGADEITWKAGVDVLSLGATKCGCLAAEAVVFFNQELATDFEQRRKRSGHLLSKGRFLAAQFEAWLTDNHWLDLASHANEKATELSRRLEQINHIRLAWPCDANEIFAIMPKDTEQRLKDAGAEFYQWYDHGLPATEKLLENEVLVRLVTSFSTASNEIDNFVKIAAQS